MNTEAVVKGLVLLAMLLCVPFAIFLSGKRTESSPNTYLLICDSVVIKESKYDWQRNQSIWYSDGMVYQMRQGELCQNQMK